MDQASTVYARGLATKVVDHFLSRAALPHEERERRRDLVLHYPRLVEAARAKTRQMNQAQSLRCRQTGAQQA